MVSRRQFIAAATGALAGAGCQNAPPRAEPAWREAPPLPYAVQEIYPVLHDGAIWVAGGFSPQARGATERVVAFDLTRSAWVERPALPTPSHHIQLVSLNGDLYAIGGFLGGATRTQWICTPRVLKLTGESWTEAAALPKPMAESVSVTHAGRIHLISGRSPRGVANSAYGDHDDIGDHFIFSPETGWSAAAPLPMARNSAAIASTGARFHVVSGRTLSGAATPAHDVYDPRTDRWESAAGFPEPHGGIAAAHWQGRVVAGGGELLQQGAVSDSIYALEQGGWSKLTTMPTPRHGHGFVVVGDALYAIGGSRRVATADPLATMDRLS